MQSRNKKGIKALMQDVRSLFASDPCEAIDSIASNLPDAIIPPQHGEGAECDLSSFPAAYILCILGLDKYEGGLNTDEEDMVRDVVSQLAQDTLRQRTDIYDSEYWHTVNEVYESSGR